MKRSNFKTLCILAIAVCTFLPSLGGAASLKVATLIYGSIQDADYSTLGYVTVQAIAKRPDVERIRSSIIVFP